MHLTVDGTFCNNNRRDISGRINKIVQKQYVETTWIMSDKKHTQKRKISMGKLQKTFKNMETLFDTYKYGF